MTVWRGVEGVEEAKEMKIEELTHKIYEEGIEKAKKQEQELLEAARREADRIVAEARSKAEENAERMKQEAAQSKAVLDRELKLAGGLALAQVKQRITDCLVDAVLPDSVASALDDPAFMEQLILEVARRWDFGRTNVDISMVLPQDTQRSMSGQFAAKMQQLLDRGIEVTFSDSLKSGFRIVPKDGSYRISFEETSFIAFFRDFLREGTRKTLFPHDEVEGTQPAVGEAGLQP